MKQKSIHKTIKKNQTETRGTVYLVGSGPGDPGLLTLRAKALLERADIVFYDHLVNLQILKFCPQAKLDYVGKIGHGHAMPQEKIIARIRRASLKHSTIVRLKGGDPFIFGRGGEEAEALAESGIRFEIIPGVTSAIAVPAYAGIPLTHRQLASRVSFLTGHEACLDHNRKKNFKHNGEETLVLLMAVKNLKNNLSQLIQEGLAPKTPAAILEWGTYPQQRSLIATVADLDKRAQEARIESPAIVVIGEVVRLRQKLAWFENRPLFGKKILVTRPEKQAAALSEPLRHWGAEVLEMPSFKIQTTAKLHRLDQALRNSDRYDWLLFTSVNTVNFFFDRMKQLKEDIRALQSVKIASVGSSTSQALTDRGIQIDRQAPKATSDSLARSLKTHEIKGKRILFPRAELARPNIVEDLTRRGAKLDVIPIYQSEAIHYPLIYLKKIFEKPPELLTFTSSLSVRYYLEGLKDKRLRKQALQIPCAVLGSVTRETAEKLGFPVVVTSKEATMDALIEAIVQYFSSTT